MAGSLILTTDDTYWTPLELPVDAPTLGLAGQSVTARFNVGLTAGAGTIAGQSLTTNLEVGWEWSTIPNQTPTLSVSYGLALATYAPSGTEAYSVDGTGDALPAGLSLNTSTGAVTGTPTTAQTRNVRFVATKNDAEADWLDRVSGPGVVWYHDFRTAAEVNQFRWSGGFGGGNDPNALQTNAGWVRWIDTDGVTGGCLECYHPAGTQEGSLWWRPFSPLATPGNGRATSDPGAGLTVHTWAPTSGGSQTNNWGRPNNTRRGLYCHSAYNTGSDADGTDFYLQLRVKMDPARIVVPETTGGKLLILAHTYRSSPEQRIVTYSYGGGQSIGRNFFRMYRGAGGSPPMEQLPYGAGDQSVPGPGANKPQVASSYGVCDINGSPNGCWGWSHGWDTVLYHWTGGRKGFSDARIEVWVCTAGQEASGYVKIWDQYYDILDNFPDLSVSPQDEVGMSAAILSAYNNGDLGTVTQTEFVHRYAQVIFSKQFIPCPTVAA